MGGRARRVVQSQTGLGMLRLLACCARLGAGMLLRCVVALALVLSRIVVHPLLHQCSSTEKDKKEKEKDKKSKKRKRDKKDKKKHKKRWAVLEPAGGGRAGVGLDASLGCSWPAGCIALGRQVLQHLLTTLGRALTAPRVPCAQGPQQQRRQQ